MKKHLFMAALLATTSQAMEPFETSLITYVPRVAAMVMPFIAYTGATFVKDCVCRVGDRIYNKVPVKRSMRECPNVCESFCFYQKKRIGAEEHIETTHWTCEVIEPVKTLQPRSCACSYKGNPLYITAMQPSDADCTETCANWCVYNTENQKVSPDDCQNVPLPEDEA